MARIDISTVIDVKAILDNPTIAKALSQGEGKSLESPISLGHHTSSDPYVHMFASASHVRSGQGTSELHVKAEVDDTFSWTLTCLGRGTNYSVLLESVVIADYPHGNDKDGSVSNPEMRLQSETIYAIASDSTKPQLFQQTAYTATAVKPTEIVAEDGLQKIAYRITFQILDAEGKSRGYFVWDPFITVEALG